MLILALPPRFILVALCVIFLLLLYGCYTDIRWLHVDNKVSYSIAVLALLMFNTEMILFKAGFILFLILSWQLKMIGGADVKVMSPIIFMLSAYQVSIFFLVFCIAGIVISLIKHKSPGFVPITAAFVMAAMIPGIF